MKRIFFLLAAAVAFVGCKKNDVDAPVTPASGVAKLKTRTAGTNTTNYTYDAQGRQTKYTNTDGSKVEIDYQPGIIYRKVYNTVSNFLYSYKYELNSDGLASRTTLSTNPDYESLTQFHSDKTPAKEIATINGNTSLIDYFYSNGNCDSLRFSNGNGNWFSTIVKTYYTDKPNVLTDANTGDNFYGKNNANMLKTEIYKYSNGTSNELATYTYEYDGQGRVIKETRTQGNDINISLLTYY